MQAELSPYLDGQEVELAGLAAGREQRRRCRSHEAELQPGSRLTFFSDGVVEAPSKDGELFGI